MCIAGTTGHSQGIISAVAIVMSSTFESFQENASKAVKWLFFSGCHAQQVFPVMSLESTIVQDVVEGGEGVLSPMLSVTGLSLKDLESQITNTNSHLPEGSKLFWSLHNGPKADVATGPACALFGLVTSLRKLHAAVGLDQSKMPSLQCHSVFSVRFLVVSAPYHSMYMNKALEKLFQEDLRGEELWQAEDLQMPVFTLRVVCFNVLFVPFHC